MGIIYKYTNLKNGKMYIGQTKRSLKIRMREHRNSKKTDGLEGAIKKYGVENFKVEIIEECPVENLNEREIYWIAFYDCKSPKGYNLTDGGEGLKNPTQETIDKISANHADVSGKNNPNYGHHRPHTQSTRDKISEAHSGENHHMFGKHHTQSTKDKMAKAATGRKASQETRDKMSASHKARWEKIRAEKAAKALENIGE